MSFRAKREFRRQPPTRPRWRGEARSPSLVHLIPNLGSSRNFRKDCLATAPLAQRRTNQGNADVADRSVTPHDSTRHVPGRCLGNDLRRPQGADRQPNSCIRIPFVVLLSRECGQTGGASRRTISIPRTFGEEPKFGIIVEFRDGGSRQVAPLSGPSQKPKGLPLVLLAAATNVAPCRAGGFPGIRR